MRIADDRDLIVDDRDMVPEPSREARPVEAETEAEAPACAEGEVTAGIINRKRVPVTSCSTARRDFVDRAIG